MNDEEILRIELRNFGGQNIISKNYAANITDAEILKREGVNSAKTDEEHQISTHPSIQHVHTISPQRNVNEDTDIEILPDEQVNNLNDELFFLYRLRLISFLRLMERHDTRYKFTILVDYSIGMFNRQYVKGRYIVDFRWAEAKDLASALIPSITKFN